MAKSRNHEPQEYKYVPVDDASLTFSTYDMGASAAILCCGFTLLTLNRDNPHKSLFVFRREDGIEDIVGRYFADRLEVKARSFFDTIKALKSKLYSD